ncbi:adhesion G protein-coupled receptor L4-like [Anneissia japonica]|uniref:adhesion G protein-coupled receptor L4-like n=1 Tax=Anneissia japonica TaxID=1529436 RepID=UPI0014255A91|nr:adhesion G protein-coupled receptor L4-like [Anneissia japonica]
MVVDYDLFRDLINWEDGQLIFLANSGSLQEYTQPQTNKGNELPTGSDNVNISVSDNNHTNSNLVNQDEFNKSINWNRILCLLAKVGVVISSVFLIITLIVICGLKDLRVLDRYRFLRHQVIALLCVNVCVGVMELHFKKHTICILLAQCLHYCLSVTQFWMLAFSTDVFMKVKHPLADHNRRFSNSRYVCWIAPVFIVVTTACIERAHRGSIMCWLVESSLAFWVFIVQVCVTLSVVLVQTGIVGYITFKKCNLANRTKMKTFKRIRSSCCGLLLLTPVVGLTWIPWLILADYDTMIVYHSCATFNCLQGFFVWFSQCVCSNKVRQALKIRFRGNVVSPIKLDQSRLNTIT